MGNTYKVYCHELISDGRKYFGATKDNLNHRWNNGKGHSYSGKMKKAIDTYGWEAFKHYLIKDNLTKDEAYNLEKELIAKHDTTNDCYGFNSSIGGDKSSLGCKRSKEAIEITRLKTTGLKRNEEFCENQRKRMLGTTLSQKTKEKLRQANLGKTLSEETKAKISLANKGTPNAMKGKKYSDEVKKNMGAKVGHITSEEAKKKIGLAHSKSVKCLETNQVYVSAREAERQTGVNYKLISMNCLGKCKSVYKQHWEFC